MQRKLFKLKEHQAVQDDRNPESNEARSGKKWSFRDKDPSSKGLCTLLRSLKFILEVWGD